MWTLLVLAASIFFVSEAIRRQQALRLPSPRLPLLLQPSPHYPSVVDSLTAVALDERTASYRRLEAFLRVLERGVAYKYTAPVAEKIASEQEGLTADQIQRASGARVELWLLAYRHLFEAGRLPPDRFAECLRGLGFGKAGAVAARHWPALGDDWARPELFALLGSGSATTRFAAVRALAELTETDEETMDRLQSLVDDASAEVAAEAVLALTRVGGIEVREQLRQWSEDEARPRCVRVAARSGLVRLRPEGRGQLSIVDEAGALSQVR